MTDLEKFHRLAKNIIAFPQDKAVYLCNDKILRIRVYPESFYVLEYVELIIESDDYLEIQVFQNGHGGNASITTPNEINWIIDKIKNIKGKSKEFLLKEIE